MAANNKNQIVFTYDNIIMMSNGQHLPVTQLWQPLIKFIYQIID